MLPVQEAYTANSCDKRYRMYQHEGLPDLVMALAYLISEPYFDTC